MIQFAALSALKPVTKLVVGFLFIALLVLALWWAVFKPRSDLAELRGEYEQYRTTMVAATKAAAEKARAAQAAINHANEVYARESDFAAERARIALADAEDGAARDLADLRSRSDDRVRNVWSQCLARPAPIDGAGVAEGSAHLSDDGAAALAPILAIGRRADVQYARAIAELTSTRQLLSVCYGEAR